MKKNYFAMAALAFGLLSFSACSNDDAFTDESTNTAKGEQCEVELTFNIGINSGAESRAGRPLYSAETKQRVNDMRVYAFKQSGSDYIYVKEVMADNGFGFNNSADNDTQTTQTTYKETMEAGTYKFLAVGLELGDEDATNYKPLALTASTTKLADVVLELNGEVDADEAFAGTSKDITISENKPTENIEIQLNRVVAGVLAYVKNVPYEVEYNHGMVQVTKVVVKAIKKASTVKWADNATTVDDVWVAGTEGSTAYDLVTISMAGMNKADDGNFYSNEGYTYNNATVVVEENSFVGGKFVLPITAPASDKYTLVVELRGNVGEQNTETALKTYPVLNGSDQDYSLDANSLYSLGTKGVNDDTEGGDGPDGDKEDDDPIDLSKEQIIKLTVNAEWKAIYDLGLGDDITGQTND